MNKHLDTIEAVAIPVSRRNFIAIAAAGSAALSAVAHAEASGKNSRLPQLDEAEMHPWAKVRNLARKLSSALSELEGGPFYAKIYPKDTIADWPISFGNIEAERYLRFEVEPALNELIARHKRAVEIFEIATNATDKILIGREPSKAARLRCHKAGISENAALGAVLAYVPYNDVSRYVKAKYLWRFVNEGFFDHEEMAILLTSMCGRFA